MAKAGELTYLRTIGEAGVAHVGRKPFTLDCRGRALMDIGMMRNFLPEPPARLLDLGCGSGWTSCFFGLMGYEVVGQDIAPDMIEMAVINKQRYQAHSTSFVVSDYESLNFHEEFEAACFYDSLHHAEDEKLALEAVYRALKPGGVVLMHEPGDGHSVAEHSIIAMKKFGVTEKDMPAYHIMDVAAEIGFKKARFMPFATDMVECLRRQHVRMLDAPKTGLKGWWHQLNMGMTESWARIRSLTRMRRLMANSLKRGSITMLIK